MLFAFMSLPRRILTTVAITLGVIALGAFYVAPVALSFDAARKAPPAARVVPTNLKDLSVSQVPGTKVSYVGYEFEIKVIADSNWAIRKLTRAGLQCSSILTRAASR